MEAKLKKLLYPGGSRDTSGLFGIGDSNIAKGLAVFLLLFYHLFYGAHKLGWYDWNLPMGDVSLLMHYSAIGKSCVALFILLSAYGMSLSEKKANRTLLQSFVKSLSRIGVYLLTAVVIYIAFVLVDWYFGRGFADIYPPDGFQFTDILFMLSDIFGMMLLLNTPSFIPTWWFTSAYIGMVLIFPLLYKITSKFPFLVVSLASFYFFKATGFTYSYYFFVTSLGIVIAHYDLFAKVCSDMRYYGPVTIVWAYGAYWLFDVWRLGSDLLTALTCIIMAKVIFSYIPVVSSALAAIGKRSLSIYLIHAFLIGKYFKDFIYGFRDPILITLVLLAISFVLAVLTDALVDAILKLFKRKKKSGEVGSSHKGQDCKGESSASCGMRPNEKSEAAVVEPSESGLPEPLPDSRPAGSHFS